LGKETSAMTEPHQESLGSTADQPVPRSLVVAAVAALGIVYGDIGTSPLYAFRVAAQAASGGAPIGADPLPILGTLSLIIWSLLLVVALKYVVLVMRADNQGEGGILALLALVGSVVPSQSALGGRLILLGLFGAALLYGDGVITPAISVVSAVEGLELVTTALTPWIKVIAVAILVALFWAQHRGTAIISRLFGPVMVLWFLVIGALGIGGMVQAPQVWQALDPSWALALARHDLWLAFLVFGAAFLALTGGEALYADMGHVGRRSIRLTWFALVLPALVLNYAGQAAVALSTPGPLGNPFFRLAPAGFELPLVLLATLATVIASQSLISGVFTLTRQAIHMGLLPRMKIVQTSAEGYGQVYLPVVNYSLMILTLAVVLVFKSSDDMAAAYGIAVSGTMLITTLLLGVAMRRVWGWPLALVAPLTAVFLIIDLGYFSSNLVKVPEGGWLPLVAGAGIFLLMRLWQRGSTYIRQRLASLSEPVPQFLERLAGGSVHRHPGLAVFLTRTSSDIPESLYLHVQRNHALAEQVIVLHVVSHLVPRVPSRQRLTVAPLGNGVWRAEAHYGFMQLPNIAVVARRCAEDLFQAPVDPDQIIYYVRQDRVIANADNPAFSGLSEWLLALLSRNAAEASDFFRLPAHQVVEVGIRIDI